MKRFMGSILVILTVCAAIAAHAQGSALPFEKSGEVRSIGPGKVSLSVTPTGQWMAFRPSWDRDVSLIRNGGVAVYARGDADEIIEVANTARGDLEPVSDQVFHHSFEGAVGGARAPSLQPDDDGDGRVDEDRLDGIDNDSDGRIDEDFAAIGDEMVTSDFRTRPEARYALAFHQELYAWSLPHIDGTVMLSLRIRNTGDEDLEDLRTAIFYTAGDEMAVEYGGDGVSLAYESNGTQLVMVPFVTDGDDWQDGVVDATFDPFESMLTATPASAAAESATEEQFVRAGGLVYSMSPVLGTLAAGEEMRIDFALIAVPAGEEPDDATEKAVRTFTGDDYNRYLPPPVAMKPRILWAYARPIPGGDGVWIDFDVLGQAEVTADDFSFFSGETAHAVQRAELQPGHTVLTLDGDSVKELTRGSNRVTLKGRLKSGEFFEAIVRQQGEAEPSPVAQEEAERFWTTPGRLTQQILRATPNPFRDVTQIAFEIPRTLEQEDGTTLTFGGTYGTTLRIYNVAGRLINTLEDDMSGPGVYVFDWSGIDDAGHAVASGVYYVKLQIEKRFITKRLIFVK